MLKKILAHVGNLGAEERRFARYFSINHLLTGGATSEELELHRDALAKAINHLTWVPTVVRPQAIDAPVNSVFTVDIRELGWHEKPYTRIRDGKKAGRADFNLFDLVLIEYPYGVLYEDSDTFDRLAEVYLVPAGLVRPIVYVRADWFVSVATQPPLYEDLLQLPFTLKELEEKLGVDAAANLESFIARRAGMTVSGVSRNNRVVERHPAKQVAGAYWKSYDFRTSKGPENIFKDPVNLNPAGGEMIFNLPNGLQGYFLANGQGTRVDAAPTEIVTDKFAEDKTVRNGLACMRCHDQGMKSFVDTVRPAVERLPGRPGFDKPRTLGLYPKQDEIDKLLKGDTERFLDAPLHLRTVAAELGLAKPDGLQQVFRLPQFAGLGLIPLASEGVIRRDMWEDYFDQVVRQLGLGVPVVPLDGLTRRDHRSPGSPRVELTTNKKGNLFDPGDALVVFVTNKSAKDVRIELIGTSAKGEMVILAPSSTVVRAGQQYRYPEKGELKVRPGQGKEQITVFVSDGELPAGELLRGTGVTDRVVHPFYELQRAGGRLQLGFDPARVVKKTIDIETR